MERRAWDRDKAIMKCPSQLIESFGRDSCKSGLQREDISPVIREQSTLQKRNASQTHSCGATWKWVQYLERIYTHTYIIHIYMYVCIYIYIYIYDISYSKLQIVMN